MSCCKLMRFSSSFFKIKKLWKMSVALNTKSLLFFLVSLQRKEEYWRTRHSQRWAIKEKKVIKKFCPSCRMRKKVSHYRGFREEEMTRRRIRSKRSKRWERERKLAWKEFKKKISWFAFFLLFDQWEKLNLIRKILLRKSEICDVPLIYYRSHTLSFMGDKFTVNAINQTININTSHHHHHHHTTSSCTRLYSEQITESKNILTL